MALSSRLTSALSTLLREQQVESELDLEIRSFVNAITDEKIAAGISPNEAHRQALAEEGGLEQIKQAVRDQRAGTVVESVVRDVHYALRQMRRNPAFTATAVASLALGIGATTAIFSAVYGLLIRPLAYPDPDRLVTILDGNPQRGEKGGPLVSPDFVAAQLSLTSFDSIAGYTDTGDDMNLTGVGDPIRVRVVGVTANLLSELGVIPERGRSFLNNEDRLDGPAVALLSHRLWQSKFGGNTEMIGQSVNIDGKSRTVVGILPAHFVFPDSAMEPDVYFPADLDTDTSIGPTKQVKMIRVIARLRDGRSLQEVEAELRVFSEARLKAYPAELLPWARGREIQAEPLHLHLTGDNRKPLLILLTCVAAVLLIACANVANLQLARTVARRHEMALRGALGAGRMRLIRQFLVESVTLATFAAILGLGIALAVTWLIRRGGMPGSSASSSGFTELLQVPFGKLSATVAVNGWVLAFTATLALVTAIVSGLVPAISASRFDPGRALQGAAMRISSGYQQRKLRSALLIAEIGLGVMLLTGAGLLLRSFINVLRIDSGFDPQQCLTARMLRNYKEPAEKTSAFVEQVLPRLQALPGVQVAAIASHLPLQNIGFNTAIVPGDGPLPPREQWQVSSAISITPQFFRATGTRILKGRAFDHEDEASSTQVAIVNRAFAQQYFHGKALGKRVRTNINSRSQGPDQFTSRTIVGLVQDVRYGGIEGHFEPAIYLPESQVPQVFLNVVLRTTVDSGSLSQSVRKTVVDVDHEQPLFDVQTMNGRVSQLVAQRRLIMLLIAAFAFLALVLAGVGVYGVFSYWVNQRRREMGIRLALGASRGTPLRLIMTQSTRLVLVGGLAGLAGAWFLDRFLSSSLVGVKVHDPLSLSLGWFLMTLIALLGSSFPALSACKTNAIAVLHSE